MTKKKERFFIHKDMVSDTEMKIPVTLWQSKEQQKKFCDELNKLNDENEKLKKEISDASELLDGLTIPDLLDLLQTSEKENKELKEDIDDLRETLAFMDSDLEEMEYLND